MKVYIFEDFKTGRIHRVKANSIMEAFKLCPQANGMILIGIMPYSSDVQLEVKNGVRIRSTEAN